jgi:hypothetical protein
MRTSHLGVVVAALLAGPAIAVAEVRYVSPTGTGTACTAAAPCQFADAVNLVAINGDVVRLAPGDHALTAGLTIAAQITIEGTPGQARPRIVYSGPTSVTAIFVNAGDVTLRHLAVEGQVDTGFGFIRANGGLPGFVLDRVVLRHTGAERALIANPVTVRDSLIVNASTTSAAGATVSGAVTGSTIVADQGVSSAVAIDNGFFTGLGTLTVRNSILRGGPTDIRVSDQKGGQPLEIARLDIDYSAYGAGRISASGDGQAEVVIGANNLTTAAPALVNAALGVDVHQLPGSPTIDAGSAVAAAGSSGDLDENARVIGAAPDIGVDEFVIAPGASTTAATAVTATTATLNGSVTPNGGATQFAFDYGPSTALGTTTPAASAGSTTTAQSVSAALTGLTPGTTYSFRVRATNVTGTAVGTTLTFTTPPRVIRSARILGASIVGTRIRCDRTGVQGAATTTVQWKRGSRIVGNATIYTVRKADLAKRLSCTVTGSNSVGTVTSTSAKRLIPLTCRVPALRGRTLAKAREIAGLAGCRTRVTRVGGSGVARGNVLRTAPVRGAVGPNGLLVTLVVRR